MQQYHDALTAAFSGYEYGDEPIELYEPIGYIMSLGGKRIRPLLTLATAHLFTEDWKIALKPAMAVEVFHNFTLMHDDIMDQAPLRRGKATVHTKWDVNTAILSGDVMLVAAYALLAETDAQYLKTALIRFNRTAAEVCEGQQLDVLFAEQNDTTKDGYLEMIRLKTSVLLGFAMELGAIVSGADHSLSQKLYDIGVNLGLGFQQMDDVLDVYADPEKFGKQVGGDILENKKTWLALRAMEKSEGTELGKELKKWFSTKVVEGKVEAVRSIFDQLNIREEGTALADTYFAKALEEISTLDIKEEKKDILRNIANMIKNREK